jgi:hypothetical protein
MSPPNRHSTSIAPWGLPQPYAWLVSRCPSIPKRHGPAATLLTSHWNQDFKSDRHLRSPKARAAGLIHGTGPFAASLHPADSHDGHDCAAIPVRGPGHFNHPLSTASQVEWRLPAARGARASRWAIGAKVSAGLHPLAIGIWIHSASAPRGRWMKPGGAVAPAAISSSAGAASLR